MHLRPLYLPFTSNPKKSNVNFGVWFSGTDLHPRAESYCGIHSGYLFGKRCPTLFLYTLLNKFTLILSEPSQAILIFTQAKTATTTRFQLLIRFPVHLSQRAEAAAEEMWKVAWLLRSPVWRENTSRRFFKRSICFFKRFSTMVQ